MYISMILTSKITRIKIHFDIEYENSNKKNNLNILLHYIFITF